MKYEYILENDRLNFTRAKQICVTALLLGIMLMLNCTKAHNTNKESEIGVPVLDINEVMKNHTQELMAIEGVVGVAIGELEDHTPCILVMIVKETDEIKAKIPNMLDGHPVSLLVSGEIRPMDGN